MSRFKNLTEIDSQGSPPPPPPTGEGGPSTPEPGPFFLSPPFLEGEALEKAAEDQSWDPSVKTLVFFPSVLRFMSENLDWTQDLGDAMLAQQDEVMAAVQKLRNDAKVA